MSVHRHGTARLPLDGFSRNLLFEHFSKICSEILSFIKICQKYQVLYMKTSVHLSQCLAELSLE